jgi:hypothetical protein
MTENKIALRSQLGEKLTNKLINSLYISSIDILWKKI